MTWATPALATSGTVLTAWLVRWLRRKRRELNLVAFSARVIAGARAEEHEEERPYVKDPLAKLLAGKKVIQDRKKYVIARRAELEAGQQQEGAAESMDTAHDVGAYMKVAQELRGASPSQRKVQRIIMRTIFFDEAIQYAVGAQPAAPGPVPSPLRTLHLGGSACKQVVLLGSGMDTRPWRLDLPPGVAWFEVDQEELFRVKRADLKYVGARVAPHPKDSRPNPKGYPLKSASWTDVSVDLQVQGWTQKLIASGFDPTLPTVWALEGLLYYMEPDTVPVMLQEAATVSAPGSVIVASTIGMGTIEHLREKRAAEAAAAAAGQASDGKGKKAARITSTASSGDIMSAFKWGLPEDAETYFSKCGWDVRYNRAWTETSQEYGLEPDLTFAKTVGTKSQRASYVLGIVK